MASANKTLDYIRANYGYLATFLDIPEIRRVLLQAAQPGKEWSPEKLQGAVYATKWWKQTAETTRSWTALESTDPATARQRLTATQTQISALAKQSGVSLTAQQVADFALKVNKFGWTPEQVRSAVGHQYKYDPKQAAAGQSATVMSQLKQVAADYLIPVSDPTLLKWTQDVLGGDIDLESFRAYAQQQAKSLFPGLAAAIDRGVTVAQYTNPYREVAARTLETDPEQIDLMSDPRFSQALFQTDPKTGEHRAMNLANWGTYLRGLPEYRKTGAANEQAAQIGNQIGELFGKVG